MVRQWIVDRLDFSIAEEFRVAAIRPRNPELPRRILRKYLRERSQAAVRARDLERINAAAGRLNREAADVLDYQSRERDSRATEAERR